MDHVLVITKIAHFTVTCGIEAGVDLVLIQPFLPSHVNHVVLMLNSIFERNLFVSKFFVSKQGQPQSHVQSKASIL